MCGFVFALCYAPLAATIVWCPCSNVGPAKSWANPLGVYAIVRYHECFCVSGGGSHGGGLLAPRYHGLLECLPKRAGRPMGPATLWYTNP